MPNYIYPVDYTFPASTEALVLLHWLSEKQSVACQLGAIESPDWPSFYAKSNQGTIRGTVDSRSAHFDLYFPDLFTDRVGLRLTGEEVNISGYDVTGSLERFRYSIDELVPVIMQTELAPYAEAPYGLVYDDTAFGIILFTARAARDTNKPGELFKQGYHLDTYVCNDLSGVFPFVNEPDVAERLRQFWGTFCWSTVNPKIVPLSLERKRQKIPFQLIAEGGAPQKAGFTFQASSGYGSMKVRDFSQPDAPFQIALALKDRAEVRVYENIPYWAWDSREGDFSTRTPAPKYLQYLI
jgi:hypothetical protein